MLQPTLTILYVKRSNFVGLERQVCKCESLDLNKAGVPDTSGSIHFACDVAEDNEISDEKQSMRANMECT